MSTALDEAIDKVVATAIRQGATQGKSRTVPQYLAPILGITEEEATQLVATHRRKRYTITLVVDADLATLDKDATNFHDFVRLAVGEVLYGSGYANQVSTLNVVTTDVAEEPVPTPARKKAAARQRTPVKKAAARKAAPVKKAPPRRRAS
jgi:hypothetical protein